jgi:TonB-linked SusC/RagA family outer membrane protein
MYSLRPWHLLGALLLLLPSTGLVAQERTITGQVTAIEGRVPLPDVAIQLVGTQRGTLTDPSGRFRLQVPAGAVEIRASLIGRTTTTVEVAAGQNEVAIAMGTDALNLDEIVVTGTATSIARRNLANAVSTVGAEELDRAPAASFEQQLAGKIAGADIQANSGAPGGGLQVNLRGVSTIIGSATPLYVVDGVIVSDVAIQGGADVILSSGGGVGFSSAQDNAANRIADLNPNDIESIEILKGASAAAIYGSKANNGVIIVTTKRGRSGAPQFSLSQRFGVSQMSNKLGLRRFETLNDAVDAFGPRAADYWEPGAFYDHEEEIAGNQPMSYETAISVNGGTQDTRYFASGLVKHDGGILTGSYYDKQSLRLNLDQNVGSSVSLKLNMNAVHSETGRGFTNNDNRSVSYWMAFPQTPTFVDLRQRADGTWPANPFANSNPLQTAALARNDEEVWRIITSGDLQIDLIQTDQQSLRLSLTGGVDFFNLKSVVYSPPDLQFEPLDGKPGTSYLGQTDNLNLNTNANLVHTWQPQGWGLTATTSLGVQYEQREQDIAQILNEDLIVGQTNIDAGTNPGVFQRRQLVKDLGLFAQEEVLLLDERLLLTAGLRADRSSNNADVDEFFLYPKFAGSYRFLDLAPGLLDELKIRAAWGQAGNQPVYGDKFSNLNAGNIAGLQTLNISTTTVAEDLHPERQKELEGGVDATLFGSRARLEATAYERRITELLLRRALPPSSGFNTAIFNGGVMKTTGFEAALQAIPVQNDLLTWTSRVTFSKDKTIVEELPVPPFRAGGFGTALGGFQVEEGKSATQIVGRDTTVIADDPRCDGPCPVGTRIVTGIGDVNPDFRIGFSNEFRRGPFTLYGLLDWQQGGDVVNLTAWLYDLSRTADDFADPCNIPGCLEGETIGQARLRLYPGRTSRVWVEDGSFVKLRELTLTYDVPQDLVQSLWSRARYLRLTFSGRNLLTFTDYTGMDPEVSNFGNQAIGRNIDVAPYPPSRSFWLSVDIGF